MKTTFKLFNFRGDALQFADFKLGELRGGNHGVSPPYKSVDEMWCVVYPAANPESVVGTGQARA